MVYDRNDRWLYKPLSYETERLCSRFACDRSNKTEVKEVKFSPEITKESGARSVSISHRSDGVSTDKIPEIRKLKSQYTNIYYFLIEKFL